MIQLGLDGKEEQAYELQHKMEESIHLIFEEGNPAGIKSLLKKIEICGDEVRLPLVKATSLLQTKIANFVNQYL